LVQIGSDKSTVCREHPPPVIPPRGKPRPLPAPRRAEAIGSALLRPSIAHQQRQFLTHSTNAHPSDSDTKPLTSVWGHQRQRETSALPNRAPACRQAAGHFAARTTETCPADAHPAPTPQEMQ